MYKATSHHHDIGLTAHSHLTRRIAEIIAEEYLGVVKNRPDTTQLYHTIVYAALLHDIGKVLTPFQRWVSDPRSRENIEDIVLTADEEKALSLPLHHEASWAALVTSTFMVDDPYDRDMLRHAVYWHHARPVDNRNGFSTYGTQQDIISAISDEYPDDMSAIRAFAQELISDYKGTTVQVTRCSASCETPDFYMHNYARQEGSKLKRDITCGNMHIIRAAVNAADRLASELAETGITEFTDERIRQHIETHLHGTYKHRDISGCAAPDGYDAERFVKQRDIAASLRVKPITFVNMPAGGGKTMIASLFAVDAEHARKTMVVVPRLDIARQNFEGICKELQALNIAGPSISMVYTGELQGHKPADSFDIVMREDPGWNSSVNPFDSDIVIINIDAFLSTSHKNNMALGLLMALTANVVFDEYHEYVTPGSGALFALFTSFMQIRSLIDSDTKTVLTSATYIPTIEESWDVEGADKIQFLPAKHAYFDAQHSKPYHIRYIDGLPEDIPASSFLMLTTRKNAQSAFAEADSGMLVHGDFTLQRSRENLEAVKHLYCKHSEDTFVPVYSAQMLKASLDISADNLFLSSFGREHDLQCFGRANRWGYSTHATINMMTTIDKSKKSALDKMYDPDIAQMWIEYFRNCFPEGSTITYRDLYDADRVFQTRADVLAAYRAYVDMCLTEHYDQLRHLSGPIKYRFPTESASSSTKLARGTIRSPLGSIYVTMKKADGSGWTNAVTETLTMNMRDFYRDYVLSTDMKKLYEPHIKQLFKDLTAAGYTDYKSFRTTKIDEVMKKFCRICTKPETPFPDLKHVYSEDLGIIRA